MSLHPVQGHQLTRDALVRARREGSFPSALLLHGPRGVGKQRLALWTGQLLLCGTQADAQRNRQAEEPCGECHACRLALGLKHPDLHWHFPLPRPKGVSADRLADALEHERAQHLDTLRAAPIRRPDRDEAKTPRGIYLAAVRTIRRRAQSRPAMGPAQVFVIGNAEALVSQEASPEAANALLKLLEEPPRDTYLILTSSEPGLLLATVRSRTVPLHVGRLPLDEIRSFLEQRTGAEAAAAERAARLGAGSIGRALGFLPSEGAPGPLEAVRRRAIELLRVSLSPRREEAFALALSFPPTGARSLIELLEFLDEAIRDLAALAAGAPERTANPDAADLLGQSVRDASVHAVDAARSLAVVERARELARGNVNPQLLVTGLTEELRRALLGQRAARTAP